MCFYNFEITDVMLVQLVWMVAVCGHWLCSSPVLSMKLGHFPFDSQIVEAHFVNISHWRTLNLERHGSSPNKELYRLAPVSRQTEGQFFKSYFDGAIMEFTLLHNRALLEEPDRETPGGRELHAFLRATELRAP